GEHELQGGVVGQPLRRERHALDEGVLEGGGRVEPFAQPGEEPVELVGDDRLDQAVLAAGDRAVDGGPATAGFPGDVLQGGLADTPAGDAAEGGIEDPLVQDGTGWRL